MLTSSNGNKSALLAICVGNSLVPGEFPHKGQWREDSMLSLMCVWINGWINTSEAGDLRRHRAQYDVSVMTYNHHGFGNTDIKSCLLWTNIEATDLKPTQHTIILGPAGWVLLDFILDKQAWVFVDSRDARRLAPPFIMGGIYLAPLARWFAIYLIVKDQYSEMEYDTLDWITYIPFPCLVFQFVFIWCLNMEL